MKFKNDEVKEMFTALHPVLIMIYADLYWYTLKNHNIDLVITETRTTLDQDKALNRVSSAHREGLAIDIRMNNIDAEIQNDISNYINNKSAYQKYKYLANSGKMRLAYIHKEGAERHMHLAIHSKYKDSANSNPQ